MKRRVQADQPSAFSGTVADAPAGSYSRPVVGLAGGVSDFAAAQDSRVRTAVVRTAMTRWPARLVSAMGRAVSEGTTANSECITWSVMRSALTGRKVSGPTWRVT